MLGSVPLDDAQGQLWRGSSFPKSLFPNCETVNKSCVRVLQDLRCHLSVREVVDLIVLLT